MIEGIIILLIIAPVMLTGNIFAQAILFVIWVQGLFGRKDSKEILLDLNSRLRDINNEGFSIIKKSFRSN